MQRSDALYAQPEMARLWSDEATLRSMCAFEAALARAEAQAGIIPHAAVEAIAAACATPLDAPAIFRAGASAGTPVIPLVRALEAHVAPAGRGYIHWGATSQDAVDTALVLQMRDGLDHLRARLLAVGEVCATLADEHRRTLMAGRTLLQQALPITFGLKAARWLALVTRQAHALAGLREQIAVVQFGGAAGTLAALGTAGPYVTELLAAELGLEVPDLPWHAERDRVAAVAARLGVLAGALAKVAQDVVLLAQSEVGEVSEASAAGRGGSSAMPQKHNPVDAVSARAAARLAIGVVPVVLAAMEQEHERAAGAWQAEWEAIPQLFRYTSVAVERVLASLCGLRVHQDRMRANLAATHGQVLAEALFIALAPALGRPDAQRTVREVAERAAAAGIALREAAQQDERVRAALSEEALDRVFDPLAYLGSTDAFIDRALADFRALRAGDAAP